ncbi:Anthranilate synthase beta subunit 1, chloroplastic [Zea mays]|uniref:anthranilate synthase n=1 Tax=Zea mays TaxID=4577 RepID=A0A3L6G9G2_MAIZE|nr:Anthranilate synthase beta subunit 1, chloroplastic [Zea mays]
MAACSHLAAAGGSSPAAAAVVRSPAHSSAAAAFARLRSTLRFSSAGLSVKGSRATFPWVAAAGPAAAAPVADLDGRPATEKQPIIVIDNYDSFTYNLCQYMGELGLNFEVYRNDELTIEDVKRKNPRGILISPGPGEPQDSGISLQTVLELGPTIPIFGVCMGLQCIGEAFGGKIIRAPSGVMHGKSSPVYYDEELGKALFNGLPNASYLIQFMVLPSKPSEPTPPFTSMDSPFTAARYHSLVIEKETFPHDALEATAWTEDGLIMAARHKKYKHIQGVQFHPESIITPEGKKIILNFIRFIEELEKQRS